MIDTRGLAFLAFTGFGALCGAVVSLPILASGFMWPDAFAWAWVPPVVGVVMGGIFGAIAEAKG